MQFLPIQTCLKTWDLYPQFVVKAKLFIAFSFLALPFCQGYIQGSKSVRHFKIWIFISRLEPLIILGGGSWKRRATARLSHVESRQNFFSESLESLWDHQHTKPISLEGSRPATSEMNEEGKPWSRVVAMGKQMEEMEVTGSHLKLRLEVLTAALVVNLLEKSVEDFFW